MAAVGVLWLLAMLVLGLGAPLLLYYLVRAEHDQRERMDRESAERAARRDTADEDAGQFRK